MAQAISIQTASVHGVQTHPALVPTTIMRSLSIRFSLYVCTVFAPIPAFSSQGLYHDSEFVVELSGNYPWNSKPPSESCPVLLEFYASWCPHCQNYAPTYSKLARRLEESPTLFAYIVAAVDCQAYGDFCNGAKVTAYPTLRDFPTGKSMVVQPLAMPYTEDVIWQHLVAANTKSVATIGEGAARDCANIRLELQWLNKNPDVVPRRWIPYPDVVWLVDQQRALHSALTADLVILGALSTERKLFPQLQAFVELASTSFPHKQTRLRLAAEAIPLLANISGSQPAKSDKSRWEASLDWLVPALSVKGEKYFGCRGSLPHRRGYTCALWQVFHALLVNSNYDKNVAPHPGLVAIHNWIQSFFGCEECRANFVELSIEMAWGSVANNDDAIIWLWRAHNSVNKRLEGEPTEDPQRQKVQFPPQHLCDACWENGTLSNSQVLSFLKRFYAGGSQYVGPEPAPPSFDYGSDDTFSSWATVCAFVIVVLVLGGLCYKVNNPEKSQAEEELTERRDNDVDVSGSE